MLAFIKRRQLIFALLLGVIVVLPGAYFSIARNRKNNRKPAATRYKLRLAITLHHTLFH